MSDCKQLPEPKFEPCKLAFPLVTRFDCIEKIAYNQALDDIIAMDLDDRIKSEIEAKRKI